MTARATKLLVGGVSALLVAGFLLTSVATLAAKSRLGVTATPANVAAGGTIQVRITGTSARRCKLTLRSDRYRATPYLRRTVARRSTLTISPRSTSGARILAVRCGRAQAYTSIRIGDEDSAGEPFDPGPTGPEPFDPGPTGPEPFDPGPTGPEPFDPGPEEPAVEVPAPPVTPAPPGIPPDTAAPSKPTSLSKTAATTSSITMSWRASTDNVGVTGYSVYRNGTRVANLAATTYKFTGLACGKSYTLGVAAYDARGNTSAAATLVAATSACPARTVSVTKGGSAQGRPGCSSSACRYLQVTFSNFSSATHTIACRASGGDEGGFYTYTRSGTSGTSAVCYYGFSGRLVWATVDGVASSKITW